MDSGKEVSLFLDRLIKVSLVKYLKLSGSYEILLLSDSSLSKSLRLPKLEGRALISLLRILSPSRWSK